MSATCFFCGDPVDPRTRTVWRRIVGWERKALAASRRGGSDIAGREPRDEFACDICVSRVQSGVAARQESLLDG